MINNRLICNFWLLMKKKKNISTFLSGFVKGINAHGYFKVIGEHKVPLIITIILCYLHRTSGKRTTTTTTTIIYSSAYIASRTPFQLMVVHTLSEIPPKGNRTGMGAQVLDQHVPAPVLPVVPAGGADRRAAHHRHAVLGRRDHHHRGGRQAGRPTVQHRRAGHLRVPGRMRAPHAHSARARRHATGGHHLPEHRSHKHRRQLQESRVGLEVLLAAITIATIAYRVVK